MAAYGALCSLMHIVKEIQHHPYPPISLDKEQVEAITEKVTFLQNVLEGYSQLVGYSDEADPLETQIADAVYAAEDAIESHIVDRIQAVSLRQSAQSSRPMTSKLIKLWVAEGFLKPIDGKNLEEVAEEYLDELVGRNLIMVEKYNNLKKVKKCKIHDLLRDLCLREARKQKFFHVVEEHSPQDYNTERRICSHQHRLNEEYPPQFLDALQSASRVRSMIWESEGPNYLPSFSSGLLRVSSVVHHNWTYLEAILQQVNLRYLYVKAHLYYDVTSDLSRFPSSLCLLWNLQTLIVGCLSSVSAPPEIWKMPQLRHVKFGILVLPDPPSDVGDIFLENLQTLSFIRNFKCSEDVVKRIPSITKLKVCYVEEHNVNLQLLNNLSHLQKLESLRLHVNWWSSAENLGNLLRQNLILPLSLKKLNLSFINFDWETSRWSKNKNLRWEDLTTRIGMLPLLEVLKLRADGFLGPEWETIEGHFCNLKFLQINDCYLECWTTDNTHFPSLERLVLLNLEKLREIPLCIGDIPTLQLIELRTCGDSVVDSAKRIKEEQEELGNEDLQVLY